MKIGFPLPKSLPPGEGDFHASEGAPRKHENKFIFVFNDKDVLFRLFIRSSSAVMR